MIELFPHIGQLLSESSFGLFTPLVKVQLDLTQSLQSSDEVVVENAEVSEWFGLRLTSLLQMTLAN